MKVACGFSSRGERLFFALWPHEDVRVRLAAEAHGAGGRSRPADGYHMTLAFVGEVGDGVRCALELAAASSVWGSFLCVLDRIDALGSGIEVLLPSASPPRLLGLAASLQGLVADVAGTVERRPYRPHVTLAGHVDHVRSVSLSSPIIWPVREYVLCRSQRTRSGFYNVLERWPLYEDL